MRRGNCLTNRAGGAIRCLGVAMAMLLALACGARAAEPTQQQIAARAGLEQKPGGQVPLHARFKDEHGATVELSTFFGKRPVLFALVYYECPNLCTLVLNGILDAAQNLKFDAGRDYEVVVVSFDPLELPALAAAKKQVYLERYGRPGTADGWHFLVGDKNAIAQVCDSVGFRFAYDPPTRQFAHPSTMVVLTPDGKISRYFPGIEYPPRDVRLALMEASQEKVGSIADRLFLLCFHYNPQTGRYGLLIGRLMQISGVGTAALLACYILASVRRERHRAH
jgi:protein SCO1/2